MSNDDTWSHKATMMLMPVLWNGRLLVCIGHCPVGKAWLFHSWESFPKQRCSRLSHDPIRHKLINLGILQHETLHDMTWETFTNNCNLHNYLNWLVLNSSVHQNCMESLLGHRWLETQTQSFWFSRPGVRPERFLLMACSSLLWMLWWGEVECGHTLRTTGLKQK